MLKIIALSQEQAQRKAKTILSTEYADTPFVAPPAAPPIPAAVHVPVLTPPMRRSNRPRNNPQRHIRKLCLRIWSTVLQAAYTATSRQTCVQGTHKIGSCLAHVHIREQTLFLSFPTPAEPA